MAWLHLVFVSLVELLGEGALFSPFVVQANIDENPVEPSIETGPAVEIAQMRVGTQKCFLRQILCFLTISREIERNAIGLLFVPLHKFLESLVIPASSQGHEIFISGLHSWTPTHQA